MTYTTMDIAELRRLVDYDPVTGKFTWLPRGSEHCPRDGGKRFNRRYAGQEAFRIAENGYQQGMIKRRMFRAHRVAWAIYHGEWPQGDIDHINGNTADNRIANLRVVNRVENCRNQPVRRNSTTGIIGVSAHGKRWRAYIGVGGKPKHIGVYETIQEAVAARKAAEARYGFHANHGRPRQAWGDENGVRWSE